MSIPDWKDVAARYLAECWSDLTAGGGDRDIISSGVLTWRHVPSQTGQDRYLGGSPVDPAFAIGVYVEQNQAFNQVGED